MIKRFSLISFIAIALGMGSCETEFSLNGDYELIPVVFGLLDQNDSIHMVKITKAFLGDGDNLVYAQNPDSSYFDQVAATVTEIDVEGDETGRVWDLTDSIVTGKSTDGIFYAPDQKVYYFEANDLNSKFTYRLDADLNEGAHQFAAETSLIDGFGVPTSLSFSSFKIRFAKNTVNEEKDYLSWVFDLTDGLKNVGELEIGYTFNWTEYYLDGSTQSFSQKKFEYSEEDVDRAIRISGLSFYNFISETIPDDLDDINYRKVDGIDLHISLAHPNLTQYMNVAEPVTGIAQVQPVFTNVEGGDGLFSSRYLFTLEGLVLDEASIKELATGTRTATKQFCSDYMLHNGEVFDCP